MRFSAFSSISLLVLTTLELVQCRPQFDVKPQKTDDGRTEYAFQGKISRDELKSAMRMAKTAGKMYSMYRNTKDTKGPVDEQRMSNESRKQKSSVMKSSRMSDSNFVDHDEDFDGFEPGSSFHKNVSIKYTRTTTV